MAVTTSITKQGVIGDVQYGIVEVTPDTDAYPSGGESIAFSTVLSWNTSLTPVVISVQASAANGYVPQWDSANSKVLIYEAGADAAALDQVVTGDMSATTMTFFVIAV
mgnify:CR=1 FL=1|jgi:hypothetical protein|tara:strand:- start:2230 stop:2553 length:324 start_codon:yes stop_codon:yes gene_type:complete